MLPASLGQHIPGEHPVELGAAHQVGKAGCPQKRLPDHIWVIICLLCQESKKPGSALTCRVVEYIRIMVKKTAFLEQWHPVPF